MWYNKKHMEKNNKVIWLAGALFAVALIIGSAGAIHAAWQAPNQDFPNQNVGVPLDTSSNPQTKNGQLTLQTATPYSPILTVGYQNAISGLALNATLPTKIFYPMTFIGGVDNQTQIQNGLGALYVSTQGLVLPNVGTSGLNATAGMITYDPSSNTVKLYNGSSWTDIGTGTGGGFWQANGSNGIIYSGGNVTISNGTTATSAGWYAQGYDIAIPNGASKMPCDTTPSEDCTNSYYSYSGTAGSSAYDTAGSSCPNGGNNGGKQLQYLNDPDKDLGMGAGLVPSVHAATQNCYKIFTYQSAQASTNTAALNVATVNASQDITANGRAKVGSLLIGKLGLSDIQTLHATAINGRTTPCKDFGVKGIVVSFTANGGGSGGQATQFWIDDSLARDGGHKDSHGGFQDGDYYTIFNDSNNVSYGGGTIKVCFAQDPFNTKAQFLDAIDINYIPLSF